MERLILHVDANNAYLSWTAVDMLKKGAKIDIRTIPSIIGGDEEARHGIVLAKSPVAKQFGIVTGETIYQAKRKCPMLSSYPVNFNTYIKYSREMVKILKENTDRVEQYSIDECFLDMTGCLFKGETIEERAKKISTKIKDTLGFTVNIGIAHNKLLAKMASDFEKPDKIHTLYENEIESKMWPLPVSELFMVGRKSVPKLNSLGLKTIGDVAHYDEKILIKRFGKFGKMIWEYANGIDNSEVTSDYGKQKGIGHSTTLKEDIQSIDKLEKELLSLCEQVCYRLRKENMYANVVNVQIRTNDFIDRSHQRKLSNGTKSTKEIFDVAKDLLRELHGKSTNKAVRLIGIRVDNLTETKQSQISLFDEAESIDTEKQLNLDKTIDNIKDKFGYNSVMRGGLVNKRMEMFDKHKRKK